MKKLLKILSHITLTLAFIAYIAYQFRTDPIGVLSGKKVTGEEVAYPADWSFSNDYNLFAVETRPGNEHSVTTIGFIHNGQLHIPARDGSTKDWPQYVLRDSRVRIKIGDQIYPAALTRVTDIEPAALLKSMAAKYPSAAERDPADPIPDVWLFRVSAR